MALRKTKIRTTRRPPRKRVAKLSKPVTKAIKKIVAGQAETKYYADLSNLIAQFNSGVNANADAYFTLSNIPQGTDNDERIGDKIQNVFCRVKGSIGLTAPLALPSNRIIAARVMYLRCKTSDIATTGLPWTSLLQGNGGYNGFTGTQMNLNQKINRNDFEVFYDKVFRFRELWSTAATQTYCEIGNLMSYFECTAKHPGKVSYQDGASSVSWNPFFCVGYAYEDGTGTIDTVTTNITVTAIQEVFFKDF